QHLPPPVFTTLLPPPSPRLPRWRRVCCYPLPGLRNARERHMRENRTEYLFSVNTHTPPTMTVESGEEFTVEVRGAFDDVEDISAVPTPFTPACDGHPLAPINRAHCRARC